MRVLSFILIILSLILVACEKEVTPVPTISPTRDQSTQEVPSPTVSATSTVARPSPSATPEPTIIVPIGPESYHLKSMNMGEVLAIFEETYNYILAEGLSGDPVEAAILFGEELLLRYPELYQNPEFLLQLAHLQALDSYVASSAYSATVFYQAVEIALNTDLIQFSRLDEWLKPYGFVVNGQFDAANLFGDGQPVQVLHIELVISSIPTDDVVFVITGTAPGNYQLSPLRETWMPYFLNTNLGEEIITVGDRNGDGRPDIASIINARGHASCSTEFSLYEWQGDKETGTFINIAPLPELWSGYFDYNCNDVWHFSPPDSEGIQSVIKQLTYYNPPLEDGCQGFQSQEIYKWNGTEYVFTEDHNLEYDDSQPDICRAGWAFYAPPEMAIQVIEPILNNWLPTYNKWGVASQDFFLFKSGVWYAMTGQSESAQMIMADLVENPPTPEYTMIPRLAAAFLSDYQSQADLFAACGAVVQTAQADLDANPRNSNFSGMEAERLASLWGFYDRRWNSFTYLGDLCGRPQAFDVSISELIVTNNEELENWAEEHKIPLYILAQHDFYQNGKADWLVAVQVQDLWSVYILSQEVTGTTVIPLFNTRFDNTPISSNFESFNFNAKIVYLVQAGEKLLMFQFEEDGMTNILLSVGEVDSFTLKLHESEPQIIIEGTTGNQETYIWNSESQTFRTPPIITPEYEQYAMIQEIEHNLFELRDTQTAVTLLEALLSGEIIEKGPDYNIPLIRPRLLYLLGMAYELTDNENQAVQTYLELQQTYPDNPYTQLAKSKLE